jgi:hypothetical protein
MTTLSLCFFKRIAYFLTQVANEKLLASHMDIEASNETVTPPQKEHAAPPPRTPHAHTTRAHHTRTPHAHTTRAHHTRENLHVHTRRQARTRTRMQAMAQPPVLPSPCYDYCTKALAYFR